MWRAFPIKEIPKNTSEDKIFYGECIFCHEGYALIRHESYPDPDPIYKYFEKFYIWEKIIADLGIKWEIPIPVSSFRGYIVDFEINNNYKNIEFPNIFHSFWFRRYIINNTICFQVESDNDIIYIKFKIIKKDKINEDEYK